MCSLKVLPRFIATFVFINISVKKKKEEELNSIDQAISKRECAEGEDKLYRDRDDGNSKNSHTVYQFFLSFTNIY